MYEDEPNKYFLKAILLILGLAMLYFSFDQLINIKEYQPNFKGRGGLIVYILFNTFGPFGEPFFNLFGSFFLIYIAIKAPTK